MNTANPSSLYLLVLFFIFNSDLSFAQDPVSTQTANNPVFFNPAFAGSDTSSVLRLGYRNQWPTMHTNYQTIQGSFSTYLGKVNAYTGVSFQHDSQGKGTIINQQLTAFYAQNFKIKQALLLRPAIELGIRSTFIDWSKLTFGSTIDPQTGFDQTADPMLASKSSTFKLNLGMTLFWKNFTLGISVHNVEKSYPRAGIQLAYNWKITTKNERLLRIQPFAFYYSQYGFSQTVLGLNVNYRELMIGAGHRLRDCIFFQTGFRFKKFQVVYSYDLTVSNLNQQVTGGSHELSLSYRFWKHRAHEKYMNTTGVFE